MAERRLPQAPPTRLFPAREGLRLDAGEERIEVYFPGPGHSPDNVVVWFSGKRILFGGCLVPVGMIGNRADADMGQWAQSLKNLSRFDPLWVVPGHGHRFDPGLLSDARKLLNR